MDYLLVFFICFYFFVYMWYLVCLCGVMQDLLLMIGYVWQIVLMILGLYYGGVWMNNEMNVDGWVMDDILLGQFVSDLCFFVFIVFVKIKVV